MSKYFDKSINEKCNNPEFKRVNDLRVDLNSFFADEFGCKKPPCNYPMYNRTLDFQRAAFDVHLRYYKSPIYEGMLLVIARVSFKKTRVGHMTRFLEYIVKISNRHNIKNVALEQTITDAGVAAAESFGFSNSFNELNWIISIEGLHENLQRRKVLNLQ